MSPANCMTISLAAVQVCTFVALTIMNYVVTGVDGAVKFTNVQIADSHPVYGLPSGWAFAIWGIIFLGLGLFSIYQALPERLGGGLSDQLIARIRIPTLALEICNVVWLIVFGSARYWAAFAIILLYLFLLFNVLSKLNIDYFASGPSAASLKMKMLVGVPFSIHAGWVTVASVLQIQINLLEEGWLPTDDFAIGLLLVAVGVAAGIVYVRSDMAYALASLWALTGIISQQGEGSTFGCTSRVCATCAEAPALRICMRDSSASAGFLPNGWASLCAGFDPSNADVCFIAKSDAVVGWSIAGQVIIALALVAGIVRVLITPRFAEVAQVAQIEVKTTPSAREAMNRPLTEAMP